MARPLTYTERITVALLAPAALRSVDRYFAPGPFSYATKTRERIASALVAFGRPDLVRKDAYIERR